MRKIIRSIFVISALVALVLCSACVSPFGEQKKQEGGLTQVTVLGQNARISFEDAYQNLKDYRMDLSSGSAGPIKSFYILAKDVDDQGKATSWVFGVNRETGSRLLIYDRNGWTDMSLSNSALPSEEIILDNVMPPNKLFAENKAAIQGNSPASSPAIRELELKEGKYTLTITSGSTVKVIKFNATTGALIV
jgi:hypothetical protein